MKECRKRQVERRGDEVHYKCINKECPANRTYVDASVCNSCPMRVFVEEKKLKHGKMPRRSLPVVDTSGYPGCEFRHKGNHCGVTNLPVTPDQCKQCTKEAKMATATWMEKAINYKGAILKWVAAGKPERTDEEVKAIWDEHCSKCAMYDKERQVCNSCGCPAKSNDQPALRNKLRMATEECPLGRFPAKVETNA